MTKASPGRWLGRSRWVKAASGAAALGMVLVAWAGSAGASTKPKGDPQLALDLKTPKLTLTAAGSTFDQPFFTRAFYEYHAANPSLTVNYASIGSGGGIAQFQADTVNFGASDVPMTAAELAGVKGGTTLQVPVDLGGEAISYNLTGVKKGLKLTGPVLADIYLGTITRWNAPQIASLNPGVHLPNEAITVIHRSDGSGTSYIFSDYLSSVSPTWATKIGPNLLPAWPVGLGGKGNEGVAGLVHQTPGAIGYVELAYAIQNNFTYAKMKNASGKYVLPSFKTVAADAAEKPSITSTDFSIVNQVGAESYPISGYSWALVYANQKSAPDAIAVARLLDWTTHGPGQSQAKALDYVPLPHNIQTLARNTIKEILMPNGKEALTGPTS